MRGRLPRVTTRGSCSACRMSKMLQEAFEIYRMQQDARHPHKMYSGYRMLQEAFAHYKMRRASGRKVRPGIKMRPTPYT